MKTPPHPPNSIWSSSPVGVSAIAALLRFPDLEEVKNCVCEDIPCCVANIARNINKESFLYLRKLKEKVYISLAPLLKV